MNDLEKFLQQNKNEKLSQFNKKLIFTDFYIYGVTIPTLRNQVKTLTKTGFDYKSIKPASLEEVLAKGMFLSYEKDTSVILKELKNLLQYFDNWCSVDVVVGSLKKLKGKEGAFIFFKKCLMESDEFVVRTGIVGLMKYFVDEKYFEKTLKLLSSINSQQYYINMAQAWAFCDFFIKNFELTKTYFALIQNSEVRKKTAQKCRDSFRLSDSQKRIISALV